MGKLRCKSDAFFPDVKNSVGPVCVKRPKFRRVGNAACWDAGSLHPGTSGCSPARVHPTLHLPWGKIIYLKLLKFFKNKKIQFEPPFQGCLSCYGVLELFTQP
jgi:hypothetical protein